MASKNGEKKISFNNQFDTRMRLENFMKLFKVVEKGGYHTHTAFGPPFGKFNIPEEKMEEFIGLYCDAMQRGCDLHIVERPRKNGPLLIDIDFNFDYKHNERLYREDDIKYVVGCANSIIRKYYKWDSKTILSFVFEKPNPSLRENKEQGTKEWKDGFHIVYPYLPIDVSLRYLILEEVRDEARDEGVLDFDILNSYDDAFDVSPIYRNGWFMYGSKKEKGQMYELTYIFDNKSYTEEEFLKVIKMIAFA